MRSPFALAAAGLLTLAIALPAHAGKKHKTEVSVASGNTERLILGGGVSTHSCSDGVCNGYSFDYKEAMATIPGVGKVKAVIIDPKSGTFNFGDPVKAAQDLADQSSSDAPLVIVRGLTMDNAPIVASRPKKRREANSSSATNISIDAAQHNCP